MLMPSTGEGYSFTAAFVDELCRCGVRHVCLSPGSRSTPLALTIASEPRLKTWFHPDERAGAFFALGMARVLGGPVALACTSGTAAANYLPAIVEARYAQVPLVVLTADRPPELLDCEANQTIDQAGLYGSSVKLAVDLPPPDGSPGMLRYARAVACRAAGAASRAPAGPVHINLPFREPLLPPDSLLQAVKAGAPGAWEGRPDGKPFTAWTAAPGNLSTGLLARIAQDLCRKERGIIVCGPQFDPEFPGKVSALARLLSWPLLADPLSQVRCGAHDLSTAIDCYDVMLRHEEARRRLAPQAILQFGAPPVSKSLNEYLERYSTAPRVIVRQGTWTDPLHTAHQIADADPARFAADLPAMLEQRKDQEWLGLWKKMAAAARPALEDSGSGMDGLFEGRIFPELSKLLPSGSTLFAGNSMPVRDMDSFLPCSSRDLRLLCNRGASGIDGVVSSALGASAVSAGPTILVLGDLSFYHDLNGLMAARLHKLKATIIVVNNDGGGIFSFLPQRDLPDYFEDYFGAPHGLTFGHAAALYGLEYRLVHDWEDFRGSVVSSLAGDRTTILELPSDRGRNYEQHVQVWKAVSGALRGCHEGLA